MTDSSQQEQSISQLKFAFSQIPFNRMLGLSLTHLDHEQAIMQFDMKEELIGNFLKKILHGGVISSVLDMAGGMAVMSAAIYKHADLSTEALSTILSKCSTIDLQISFLNIGKGEQFIAKAHIIKSGSRISFTRMTLVNQQGTEIACAHGTYFL
jgi:uncharacterized protein (TIGR00369 family)